VLIYDGRGRDLTAEQRQTTISMPHAGVMFLRYSRGSNWM